MKKILLSLLAILIVFSVSAQVNLLKNGDMEEQGAWKIAQQDPLDTIWYEFGSTEETVNGGEGGNLAIKHEPAVEEGDNIMFYQALDLVGGEEYLWHCAMRDLTTEDGNCWWIKYVWVAIEPTDGSDPDEEDIAFMHPWMGGNTIYGFNGLFDTCTVAIAAESKTNIFIPPTDATYYVGINFGTCYDTGNYHFIIDEIAMIDQDSVPVGIYTQLSDNSITLNLYPNPATTIINFAYSISENSDVELSLINILGQEVAIVAKELKSKGTYKESFDCSKLTNGMYYGMLKANNTTIKKKFIILK